MGTAADRMWEQYEEEQEAEEAKERAARLATPEGRKAELERERVNEAAERARREDDRARVEQERRWAADHPDEWEAWVKARDLLVFEFAGATFPDFLKAVGERRTKDRVLRRKDPSKQYTLDNLRWVTQKSKGGLKPEVVEELVHTLKEMKDSLGRQPTDSSPSTADPNRMLTKAEVAEQFNVTPRTIDRWRARNKLKEFVVGGVVRFRPEDVAALKKRGMKPDR